MTRGGSGYRGAPFKGRGGGPRDSRMNKSPGVKMGTTSSRGIVEPSSEDPYAPNDQVDTDKEKSTDLKEETQTTDGSEDAEKKDTEGADADVKKYENAPNKKIEKKFNGRCRLFVANLNNTVSDDDLNQLFSEFGETGEIFVNRERGFGFIRMDYRHNAVKAKQMLDKVVFEGRVIQVRFATHASAIELHGLNQFASNEFIAEAMQQFGQVERCTVVCDERGRSKGYAIVEFVYKKAAQKVLERLRDELFCLGRLPKPVFAKPYTETDEEEGIHENDLERINGFMEERDCSPRFIQPNSIEYEYASKWRNLFLDEEEKKKVLSEEMKVGRYNLEVDMEHCMHEKEAMRMREELARKQEDLRQFEEQMLRRRESSKIEFRDRDYRNTPQNRQQHRDESNWSNDYSRNQQQSEQEREIAFNASIANLMPLLQGSPGQPIGEGRDHSQELNLGGNQPQLGGPGGGPSPQMQRSRNEPYDNKRQRRE